MKLEILRNRLNTAKLITYYPNNWNGYFNSAKVLSALGRNQSSRNSACKLNKISKSIQSFKHCIRHLPSFGRPRKVLECSILLISYYPKKWNGYGRAAQELITFRRFEEAQNKVQAGLEKIPNNFNLLNIASDAFRASKDLIKSLEYAELLATHHPKNWQSILKKSECLCELGKLDQAKIFLDQELKNNSANFSLSAKQLQLSKLFSSSDEIIDIFRYTTKFSRKERRL